MLEMIDFVIRAGAPEPIGYKGENLAKTLEIITDSGPGWSYRLEARMGGDAYIVAALAYDDGILSLPLSSTILQRVGTHTAQVVATQGDVIRKSSLFQIRVNSSVNATKEMPGEEPSVFEEQLRQVSAAAGRAAESAEAAEDALDELRRGIESGDFRGETGPAGPQGERGERGPAGPQGEPGESFVPAEKEWVLKGTITTAEKDTGVNVDLSGCTELAIISLVTGTGDVHLYSGNHGLITQACSNNTRTTFAAFKDTYFGYSGNGKYTNGSAQSSINIAARCFEVIDRTHISDLGVISFKNSELVTSCNVQIYAR